FFFASRRRHTSFSRDWSSDVCSSDLRSRAPSAPTAPGPVTATAASGAVGADGALDLDAGSSTEMAHLDATALLEQLGLDTLTDRSEERRVGKARRARWPR